MYVLITVFYFFHQVQKYAYTKVMVKQKENSRYHSGLDKLLIG